MQIIVNITRGHTIALFKIITLGLLLGLGIQFLFAWVAPSGVAPTGNVAAPLTTGTGDQIKVSGDISLSDGGNFLAGGYVAGNIIRSMTNITSPKITSTHKICLNGDCITSWPAAAVSQTGYAIGWYDTGLYYISQGTPSGLLTPRCNCDTQVESIPYSTYVTNCGLSVSTNGKGTGLLGGKLSFIHPDIGVVCYDQVQTLGGGYRSIPYYRIN